MKKDKKEEKTEEKLAKAREKIVRKKHNAAKRAAIKAKKKLEEAAPVALDEGMTLIRKSGVPQVEIHGEWQDTIRYVDGTTKVVKGPIKPNQIQNSFSDMLTALCKGEAGFSRIGYLAVGVGLISWDSSAPPQPYSQTTLQDEYFRKAISAGDIVFIDPLTNLPTGGTPSSKIEISCLITTTEAIGTMREFGLFGGEATATLDSGQMVNWIVHDRIDKDTTFEIERIVRLEFATR